MSDIAIFHAFLSILKGVKDGKTENGMDKHFGNEFGETTPVYEEIVDSKLLFG